MIYSSRLKRILDYCLSHEAQFVSMDELSALLKTSKRTIFRELHDVDEQLKPYGIQLKTQSGKGIYVIGDEEHRSALLNELKMSNVAYLNKEERQYMLIFELLRSSELQKLIHYANIFEVSEATISNDLDVISSWFKNFHIDIVRKPGLGVELQGNEQDMRKAMRSIIHDTLRNHSYSDMNYLNSQEVLQQIFMSEDRKGIMHLLNQDILERILQVFHQYLHELQLDRYAQSSYIGLIIHLTIAIDRLQKYEKISECENVMDMVKDETCYQTACTMAHLLEIEFDIEIPEVEIAFIALHIKGSKISYLDDKDVDDTQIQTLALLITNMLDYYEHDVRIRLQQDEKLFQGLITHLEPAITRLKNGLTIYNPLLTELKKQYPELFRQTKNACQLLEEVYDCQVSDDEVGFITMHIGAALERNEQVFIKRNVTIGVVCASGIGVSALLSARIAKTFPSSIILKTLSMEDVLKKQYVACDMLVSTFELQDIEIPWIQVDPLLNRENVKHIDEMLQEVRKQDASVEHVSDVEQFCFDLTQIRDGSSTCLDILQHLAIHIVDETHSIQEIIALISDDLGNTIANKQIIQEDLLHREQMGSVILKDAGFALLHAKSKGVTHCIMSIYYPEKEMFEHALANIRFILVLLMPAQSSPAQKDIMALCSRSLLEYEDYIQAAYTRDITALKQALTSLFQTWFEQF